MFMVKTIRVRSAIIVAVMVALTSTGCAAGTASPAASGVTGSPSATASDPTPSATATSSGWRTTIPSDLTLPHQSEGSLHDYEASRLYDYVCMETPPRLTAAPPVDSRADRVDGTNGLKLIERLALYSDASAAQNALEAFRGELRLCGNYADELGYPMHWREVPAQSLAGADAAFHVNMTRDAQKPGWDPPRPEGVFLTMVRVGNAVYFLDERPNPSLKSAAAVQRAVRTSEREVSAFLPKLDVFRHD